MANNSNVNSIEILNLDDCEALLNFPYHEYVTKENQEFSESEIESQRVYDFQNKTTCNFDVSLDSYQPECAASEKINFSEPETEFQNPSYSEISVSNSLDPFYFLHEEIKKEPTVNEDCMDYNECLTANQSLQKKLQEAIKMVEIALEKNLDKQEEYSKIQQAFKKSKEEQKYRYKAISLFAYPYFCDSRKMVPPNNEDAIEKMKRNDLTAYDKPPKPWQVNQLNSLFTGVKNSVLNEVVKPYKERHDYLLRKLVNEDLSANETVTIKEQIENLQKRMDFQKARPLTELLKEAEEKIDWMTVSSQYLDGSKSDFECEIMWKNYSSPFVNKNEFTKTEDNNLKRLVRKYKERNWDVIAKELNTNRTAIQCFQRYQIYFNKKLTQRCWTPEEDEKLKRIINSVKIGNYIPWHQVYSRMDGWKHDQIRSRYFAVLRKPPPFTAEEDAMIIACAKVFGNNFVKMKQFLTRRETSMIKNRYFKNLDPTIKLDAWTETEDMKLIDFLKIYGHGKWMKIAQNMPGRTAKMCKCRIKRLKNNTHRRFKKNRKEDLKLKPVIPSYDRLLENMKSIQNEAYATLQTALENIRSDSLDTIEVKNLELPTLSENTLKLLHNELFKGFDDQPAKECIPHYCESNIGNDESDEQGQIDEDDSNSTFSEDDVALNATENLWLHESLKARLKEEACLINSKMQPSARRTEILECEYYRSFLRKKFFSHDQSKDVNWNLDDDNFEQRISDAINFFIAPKTEKNHSVVLCPNFATASAFEIIEITKERIQRTSSFVNQSKPYLAYLMGYSDEKPKCSKCKTEKENAPEALENLLRSMQDKLLIVDEDMQKCAEVEAGFSSTTCKCKELADSKKAFNLLQKRFLSIFLWPFLLATTDLSPEQEKLITNYASKIDQKRTKKRKNNAANRQLLKKFCATYNSS